MNKAIVIIILLIGLLGCGGDDYEEPVFSGERKFSVVCIDNVEYILSEGGQMAFMAPHLKTDGKPYLCE